MRYGMEKVEVLLEGLDENDIDSILNKTVEIREVSKELERLEEMMKDKLKAFLKERRWDRYTNEKNKYSVTITKQQRSVPDKKQLEMMLTPSQMAQAFKITTFEKISIITPEDRERLKNYVR